MNRNQPDENIASGVKERKRKCSGARTSTVCRE